MVKRVTIRKGTLTHPKEVRMHNSNGEEGSWKPIAILRRVWELEVCQEYESLDKFMDAWVNFYYDYYVFEYKFRDCKYNQGLRYIGNRQWQL